MEARSTVRSVRKGARKAESGGRGRTERTEHTEHLNRLRRIKGQVEGIERMIEDGRYCLDIVHQIRSIMAALRAVEGLVMETHIRHCVKDAIEARDEKEVEARISELLTVFNKR